MAYWATQKGEILHIQMRSWSAHAIVTILGIFLLSIALIIHATPIFNTSLLVLTLQYACMAVCALILANVFFRLPYSTIIQISHKQRQVEMTDYFLLRPRHCEIWAPLDLDNSGALVSEEMTDSIYAYHLHLRLLTDEESPRKCQRTFGGRDISNRVLVQLNSDEAFTLAQTINDFLKKGSQESSSSLA